MDGKLKSLAKASWLYPVYRKLLDRWILARTQRQFHHWSGDDQKRHDFYRQFIAPGDLVFDVGANFGNRTKVFSRLGARVIAVEPQPVCADFLGVVLKHDRNVRLLRVALGAVRGSAEMHVSNAHTISSLSPGWIKAVTESGRFAEYNWDNRVTVQVDTLDSLIAQFGRPVFVKIDVEGFEDQVIAGLSSKVAYLSFEFADEFLAGAHRCIDHLVGLGLAEFQFSLGESMRFELDGWVDQAAIKDELAKVHPGAFGDVYVRFPDRPTAMSQEIDQGVAACST